MVKKKEPIYMKWWAWVIIFFITSLIINYTNAASEAEQQQVKMDILMDETVPEDDLSPVMASVPVNEQQTPVADEFSPTTFLIGTDLPSGDYFVMAKTDAPGYVLLTRSPSLTVSEIIWQKHFENHAMMHLQDGQYLTIKHATLLPLEDAIVPNFEHHRLLPGTYRIGIDIPPGIYTLFPFENKTGYFEIATSIHHLEAHTRERRNFDEPITIALNLGDHFTFMRAVIKK
ncbi:MAG: hypothetical protein FWG67_05205 [Defluviitaleaceae bacterium]|nr:hypothetical protein [Defluviitaleaceae bacterium]